MPVLSLAAATLVGLAEHLLERSRRGALDHDRHADKAFELGDG